MKVPIALPPGVVDLGTILSPYPAPELSDSDIEAALASPIWPAPRRDTIFDVIRPGEAVAWVVSDYTRRTAADRLLPLIFRGLCRQGCRLDDMSILVASGIHRPPTDEELRHILGPAVHREFLGRIHRHDPDDEANLVVIGTTRRGHDVTLNRRAVEARRLVIVGGALYHYHAGFGGGRKSLVPGLAGRRTIAFNHSLTLDPDADRLCPGVDIGRLDGNPVAEEMLEGANLRPPDITVNTVLTPDGRLAGVFSGDMDAAHRAACRLVERLCRVDLPRPADLVVASAGSAPNWIQSHKALFNASRAVTDSGLIALLAPCPEGIGNDRFLHWMRQGDLGRIYAGLRKAPEVLGQTALSTRLRGARTFLVSEGLSPADVKALGMTAAPDLATALGMAIRRLAAQGIRKPTVYQMPQAGTVVPFIAPRSASGE